MDSLHLVLLNTSFDNVPIYCGDEKACRDYCQHLQEHPDKLEEARRNAMQLIAADIAPDSLVEFWIVRLDPRYPTKIESIDYYDVDEGEYLDAIDG